MKNLALWNYVSEHYENLIKENFDYSLQLNLVRRLVDSQYADFLYPSTSHFCLIISSKENFSERLNFPSIAVQQLDEQRFEVTYSPKQIQMHNVSKRTLHHSEVWAYLESLILKLKLKSKEFENN